MDRRIGSRRWALACAAATLLAAPATWAASRADRATADLLGRRLGGHFYVLQHGGSETPSLISAPGTVLPGDDAADRASRFVAAQADVFGLNPSDLAFVDLVRGGGAEVARFTQRYGGVPVLGARVSVAMRGDRLQGAIARTRAGLNLSTIPTVDEAEALAAAQAAANFQSRTDRVSEVLLAVDPSARGGRLVWRVRMAQRAPNRDAEVLVDAHTAEVLSLRDRVLADAILGVSSGPVQLGSPVDGETPGTPFAAMHVELDRFFPFVQEGPTKTTDETGTYFHFFAIGDFDLREVKAHFTGPAARIVENGTGPLGEYVGYATPGQTEDIAWTDANSNLAERSAFYHANVMHRWLEGVDPTFAPPVLNPIDIRVNIDPPEGIFSACNAFFSPEDQELWFTPPVEGICGYSTVDTIIYHEYGHAITDAQYGGVVDYDLHEGRADAFACYQTRQPLIGVDYPAPGDLVRSCDNDRVWPAPECEDEPHCVGEALGGALWDARSNLWFADPAGGDELAERYLLDSGVYQPSIADYCVAMLWRDDTDADLTNGTPNLFAIGVPFIQHGIPCPLSDDADGDGVPDQVDNCADDFNPSQGDVDGDGVGTVCDNCALVANTDQTNTDGDGAGDACDADDDNDGLPDAVDNCPVDANVGQQDADGDGTGDACDCEPADASQPPCSSCGGSMTVRVRPDGRGERPDGLTYGLMLGAVVFSIRRAARRRP